MRTALVRNILYGTILVGALTMVFVVCQIPMRKHSTVDTLEGFEDYMRRDLSEKERGDLNLLMEYIPGNEEMADDCRFRAQLGGAALFLLLIFANAVALATIRKRYGRARSGSPPPNPR